MADIWSKEKCSEVMCKIKGNGNKSTELALLQLFKSIILLNGDAICPFHCETFTGRTS